MERSQREESRRKGQTYGSGMAVEATIPKENKERKTGEVSSGPNICAACGLPGHQRRSSKKCPLNKNRQQSQGETNQSLAVSLKDPPLSTTTTTHATSIFATERDVSTGESGTKDRP